ncbi:MAG: septal ring lytic transglycosylase RlpA family protein [Coleofasciculus sp. C1-SOL-03]|uniref:septal ring lytic transglycosylase RlpA family protein n=1 Tax=Coleofasciculus sp. C1-SOL-03 TaxID=3069522 RepID=UPI0032FBB315
MTFFGLVWTTSWVGCLLASSQGLLRVPDYIANALPAKVLSVVNSPLEQPTSRFFSAPVYSDVWSNPSPVTTFAKSGFTADLGSLSFPFAQTATVGTHPFRDTAESVTCPAKSDSPHDRGKSQSTYHASSTSGHLSDISLPQKIWKLIENLFSWGQSAESNDKTWTEEVVLIRPLAQTGTRGRKKSQARGVKRGFLQYTQRKKKSADVPEKQQFQVVVKGRAIAQLPTQKQAEQMAKNLTLLFCNASDVSEMNASVRAMLSDGIPVVKAGDRLLFKVDDSLTKDLDQHRELLAIEWANNLRLALGQSPLSVADAQQQMYNLVETPTTIEGIASWYGPYFHGRYTATGELYDQHDLTAAHPTLPFDTYLKVKNVDNGQSVIVRINDRGPYIPGRTLDLSRQAARSLQSEKVGVIPFEATLMKPREKIGYWELKKQGR